MISDYATLQKAIEEYAAGMRRFLTLKELSAGSLLEGASLQPDVDEPLLVEPPKRKEDDVR